MRQLVAFVFVFSFVSLNCFALPEGFFDFQPDAEYKITKADMFKNIIGKAEKKPWSGSWFPLWKNKMIMGTLDDHSIVRDKKSIHYKLTPFQKYGLYVKRKYGNTLGFSDNDAVIWEKDHHSYLSKKKDDKPFWYWFDWRGHCDGLAAAAILSPQPERWVVKENILFTPGDLKALLVESHIDVLTLFFGNKYKAQRFYKEHKDGDARKDYEDVKPEVFHKILLYYIKKLKYPIAMDFATGQKVHNHPVYEFLMYMRPMIDRHGFKRKNWVSVTVDAVYADYDDEDFTGTNRQVIQYYYDLKVNDKGVVVGGKWSNRQVLFRNEQRRKFAVKKGKYSKVNRRNEEWCYKWPDSYDCYRERWRTAPSRRKHPDFIWIPYRNVDPMDEESGQNYFIRKKIVNELLEGSYGPIPTIPIEELPIEVRKDFNDKIIQSAEDIDF